MTVCAEGRARVCTLCRAVNWRRPGSALGSVKVGICASPLDGVVEVEVFVGELAKHPRRLACLTPLLGRLPHLRPDDPPQPLVARQPEHVIDSVGFTPTHQLIPAEA